VVTWDDVRRLALELPEAVEAPHYNATAFKIRGRAFAGRSRHEGAIWVRCDPDERPLIVASDPARYRLTPHFEGACGHLLIWLKHADHDDVRERLIDGWLLMAPKRLAASFES
jgi:hypothetical protein